MRRESQPSRRKMLTRIGGLTGLALGTHAVSGAADKQPAIAKKGEEATKANIEKEATRQQQLVKKKKFNKLPVAAVRQVQDICCTSPIPAGWIKVNDHWSPTSCGNPTTIVYNVCTIEKYSDMPVGAVMNVCASAKTPTGWVDINTFWSPNACGHPTTIVHNMKQIKRVS